MHRNRVVAPVRVITGDLQVSHVGLHLVGKIAEGTGLAKENGTVANPKAAGFHCATRRLASAGGKRLARGLLLDGTKGIMPALSGCLTVAGSRPSRPTRSPAAPFERLSDGAKSQAASGSSGIRSYPA